MASRLASHFPRKHSQADKDRLDQVRNHAGGFVFALDAWKRLDRFLVLGVDGGTYYQSERALALENARCVVECLDLDGARTVATIVAVSTSGRAPKNDAAIFALALASAHADLATRRAALEALPLVCRTGTHLFQFATAVQSFRKWGRGLRRAVARWYLDAPIDRLVYQCLKYRQRDGFSHRDLLRLAHPTPKSDTQRSLFRWVSGDGLAAFGEPTTKGAIPSADNLPESVIAFESLQHATTEEEVLRSITTHRFTHEMLPTEWKRSARVWDALLRDMPMTALLRSLAQLTTVGLLTKGSLAAEFVVGRLTDATVLAKARVHPLAVLAARLVYAQGHGVRSSSTWTPVSEVVAALELAYERAFRSIVPSGRRFLLGLDVSGSMDCGVVGGVPSLTPRLASAAMAMATLRTEPACATLGFSHQLVQVPITAAHSLDEVVRRMRAIPMGGTDCALPMIHATTTKTPVDVFVIYTDNETWFGNVHPYQALRRYREATGIPAKLAVVGLTATEFSIADPTDSGSMDFVGFDSAAPAVLSDFARG